uniref:Uncharacterized protein n=1 Tax=mine drainage metagenome TaxID=410659 RepID=E6PEG4_9ZZZZ
MNLRYLEVKGGEKYMISSVQNGTSSLWQSLLAPSSGTTAGAATNNPFSNVNLSAQQKSQISAIISNAQSQGLSFSQVKNEIANVLSSTQQQRLRSDLQSLRGKHHGRSDGDGDGSATASSTAGTSTDAWGVQVPSAVASSTTTGLSALSTIAASYAVQSQTQSGLFSL